jgi:hypothetical protein
MLFEKSKEQMAEAGFKLRKWLTMAKKVMHNKH